MIIFHEGLPGSGKSYGAMADHIVPALRKGRKVFCYIEGLDFKKIAEVTAITEDKCRELLIQLTREQVPEIHKYVENDSFVVIDELQNFFPDERQPLNAEMTQFITEHRHRGLDILAMGQLLKDCHKLWRNRTSQKVSFHQLDARGKPDEYKWTVYKGRLDARGNVQFDEVNKGKLKYNPEYFGTYASHTEETENKATFQDARANIWNNPVLKRYLPAYGAAVVVGLGFLVWAFAGGGLAKSLDAKPVADKKTAETSTVVAAASPAVAAAPVVTSANPAPPQVTEYRNGKVVGSFGESVPANQVQPSMQNDYIDQLCAAYRIRLTGLLRSRGKMAGLLEWRDQDGGVKEMLSLRDITGLGWLLLLSPDGTIGTLQKGDRRYIVTAWPLGDYKGTVSAEKNREIKGGASARSEVRTDAPLPETAAISARDAVPGNDSTNPRFNKDLRG